MPDEIDLNEDEEAALDEAWQIIREGRAAEVLAEPEDDEDEPPENNPATPP